MKISEVVEEITPKMAETYLSKIIKGNYGNKYVSQSAVIKMHSIMKNDEWYTDASPIIFDDDGGLIDGQLRLHALIRLGKPVKMLVKRGVNPKSFKKLEVGKVKMKVTEVVEVITPEIASQYLKKNINTGEYANRTIKQSNVAKIYNIMKNDEWYVDVNPIIFDSNGNMIDGQHRLIAIIKLGKPIKMLVKRGVNPESFKGLDQSESRDAVDFADIERKDESKKCIPVFRWLYNQQVSKSPTSVPKIEKRLSEYDLQKWGYENHSGVIDAVKWIKANKGDGVVIQDRVLTYLAYNFSNLDKDLSEEYLKYLTQMDGSTEYPTFSMVKLRVIKYLHISKSMRVVGRVQNEWIMSNVISGWNAVREGRLNLTKFKINPTTTQGSFDIN